MNNAIEKEKQTSRLIDLLEQAGQHERASWVREILAEREAHKKGEVISNSQNSVKG